MSCEISVRTFTLNIFPTQIAQISQIIHAGMVGYLSHRDVEGSE